MVGATWNVSRVHSLNVPGSSTIRRVADGHPGAARAPVEHDGHRDAQRRMPDDKRILGPLDRGVDAIVADLDRHPDAALLESRGRRTRGKKQERPLRAQQIGHRHRAQFGPVEVIRRKGHRHPQDRAPDAVLAQNGPEGLRFSHVAKLGAMTRNQVAADPEKAFDLADSRRREKRQVGFAIAIEEIENIVARRIASRAERGPCDGGHGRASGPQPPIASRRREAREVRQLALAHQLVGHRRILAVEANDDEPSDARARRNRPADEAPHRAKRPHQQRGDCDDNRGEEDEKRREHREARARSDVGVSRRRQRQQRDERQRDDETNGA